MTTRRGRRKALVRAAKFHSLSSAVSERALTMPEPPVSTTQPVGRAMGAFDIALQLWNALRDAIRAVRTRASQRARGPWHSLARAQSATRSARAGVTPAE